MSRGILSVGFVACVAVGLAAAPGTQTTVSLLVTALDKDDTPVRDLKASEWLVFEDGAQRQATEARLTTEPLSVLLLIDTAKAPMGQVEPTRDVRTAVQTFIKTVFAGGAPVQMAMMEYAGAGTMLRNYTDKQADLESSASRIVPNQRANAVLLETLIDAPRDLRKRPSPRRAIVILDRGALESSRVQGERVMEEVSKSGASVWSISLPAAFGGSSPHREVMLDALTVATGGVRLTAVSSSALEMMMQKVAEALTSQYVVTYTRPAGSAAPQSIVPAASRGTKFLRAPVIQQ